MSEWTLGENGTGWDQTWPFNFKWGYSAEGVATVFKVQGGRDGRPYHRPELERQWGRPVSLQGGDVLGQAQYVPEEARLDGTVVAPAYVLVQTYYAADAPPAIVEEFEGMFPGAEVRHTAQPMGLRGARVAAEWDLHAGLGPDAGFIEPVVKWAYSPQDGFLCWPADDEHGRPYHEEQIRNQWGRGYDPRDDTLGYGVMVPGGLEVEAYSDADLSSLQAVKTELAKEFPDKEIILPKSWLGPAPDPDPMAGDVASERHEAAALWAREHIGADEGALDAAAQWTLDHFQKVGPTLKWLYNLDTGELHMWPDLDRHHYETLDELSEEGWEEGAYVVMGYSDNRGSFANGTDPEWVWEEDRERGTDQIRTAEEAAAREYQSLHQWSPPDQRAPRVGPVSRLLRRARGWLSGPRTAADKEGEGRKTADIEDDAANAWVYDPETDRMYMGGEGEYHYTLLQEALGVDSNPYGDYSYPNEYLYGYWRPDGSYGMYAGSAEMPGYGNKDPWDYRELIEAALAREGGIEPVLISGPGGWTLGRTAAEVVPSGWSLDNLDDYDRGYQGGFSQRTPWIYDLSSDRLYIGAPSQFHGDLMDEHGIEFGYDYGSGDGFGGYGSDAGPAMVFGSLYLTRDGRMGFNAFHDTGQWYDPEEDEADAAERAVVEATGFSFQDAAPDMMDDDIGPGLFREKLASVEVVMAETEGWDRDSEFWRNRRPVIYLPSRKVVFVGSPGTHHDDLYDEFKGRYGLSFNSADEVNGEIDGEQRPPVFHVTRGDKGSGPLIVRALAERFPGIAEAAPTGGWGLS